MYPAYQDSHERVFVKESSRLGFDLEGIVTTPKEWLGFPIIVFRRAFQMVGSLYLDSGI